MSEDLYIHMCDDAVMSLNEAEESLKKVRDAILRSGNIGVRFSSQKASEAINHIVEARKMIDQLPAEIGTQV